MSPARTPLTRALTLSALSALALLAGCAPGEGGGGGAYEGDGVTLRAVFIDVWQGDSALFLLPGGEVVLVDGGDNGYGNSRVVPVLEEWGVESVDLLVLTHPHADHCGGLDEVMAAVAVDEIWENGEELGTTAYGRFAQARDASGAAVRTPPAGETRSFGGVTLEVLATDGGYPEENNDSLVMRLSYGGVRFLLAGDAEEEEQGDLLATAGPAGLAADVLKVPHHGSYKFDEGFPPAVAPAYAVISSGEGNDYGHPHAEALAAYGEIGAAICRTDQLGDVAFATDGAAIESGCE